MCSTSAFVVLLAVQHSLPRTSRTLAHIPSRFSKFFKITKIKKVDGFNKIQISSYLLASTLLTCNLCRASCRSTAFCRKGAVLQSAYHPIVALWFMNHDTPVFTFINGFLQHQLTAVYCEGILCLSGLCSKCFVDYFLSSLSEDKKFL